MEASDTIKNRIAKVLEIAKRGGTEAEADTAMRMTLELLAKHNLTMSDVESSLVEDEDIIDIANDADNHQIWQRWIWDSIARLYFCQSYGSTYYLAGKKRISYTVVGRRSNVETVKDIASYLISLCKELAKSAGQDTLYRNSFKSGFGTRIAQRCIQEKNRAELAHTSSNNERGLTLTSVYALRLKENRDYLKDKGIRLHSTASKSRSYRNESGYGSGYSAAGNASLSTSAKLRIE